MAVFPDITPEYSFIEKPIFNTLIVDYGNNNEQRISLASEAKWSFVLQYKVLRQAEKEQLQQFFLDMKGSATSFTFYHPAPSAVLGTDGNNYRCIKTHTSSASTHPITGGDWATYWVLDNTLDGTPWVDGMFYKYDFLVRFGSDEHNFDMFSYQLWEFNTVELIGVTA